MTSTTNVNTELFLHVLRLYAKWILFTVIPALTSLVFLVWVAGKLIRSIRRGLAAWGLWGNGGAPALQDGEGVRVEGVMPRVIVDANIQPFVPPEQPVLGQPIAVAPIAEPNLAPAAAQAPQVEEPGVPDAFPVREVDGNAFTHSWFITSVWWPAVFEAFIIVIIIVSMVFAFCAGSGRVDEFAFRIVPICVAASLAALGLTISNHVNFGLRASRRYITSRDEARMRFLIEQLNSETPDNQLCPTIQAVLTVKMKHSTLCRDRTEANFTLVSREVHNLVLGMTDVRLVNKPRIASEATWLCFLRTDGQLKGDNLMFTEWAAALEGRAQGAYGRGWFGFEVRKSPAYVTYSE